MPKSVCNMYSKRVKTDEKRMITDELIINIRYFFRLVLMHPNMTNAVNKKSKAVLNFMVALPGNKKEIFVKLNTQDKSMIVVKTIVT